VPLLIGILIALAVGLLARVTGMDRDRAYYPTALIVIAAYYVLFAAMAGSTHALIHECLAATVFLVAAIAGFRSSLWVVVVATAAHGVFDFVHAGIISNPGMPLWWPQFCGAADVGIAAWLAWMLARGSIPSRAGNATGQPGVASTC
jgi:hypothetical protein